MPWRQEQQVLKERESNALCKTVIVFLSKKECGRTKPKNNERQKL
jgi:hypothetical protein